MTYSATTISAAELARFQDDAPAVLSGNQARSATDIRWNTGVDITGADITATDGPVTAVYDSLLHTPSYANSAGGTAFYLHFAWASPGITVNTVVIKPVAMNGTWDVDCYFRSNSSGGTTVSFGSTSSVSDANRIVYAPTAGTQYNTVRWMTIAFTAGSSTPPPYIGEVFVGARRQLSFKSDVGNNYDNDPRGSDVRDFKSRSRIRRRFVLSDNFQDHSGTLTVDGSGLDDISTIRGIRDDSARYSRAVWWLEDPYSNASNACFGHLEPANLPYAGYQHREWDYSFEEMPPFAADDV